MKTYSITNNQGAEFRAFYDRAIRFWTVYPVDKAGYQIDVAYYYSSKEQLFADDQFKGSRLEEPGQLYKTVRGCVDMLREGVPLRALRTDYEIDTETANAAFEIFENRYNGVLKRNEDEPLVLSSEDDENYQF